MNRTVVFVGLMLAGLVPLAACGSGGDDNRHFLSATEQKQVVATDSVTRAINSAGFPPTWTSAVAVGGQGTSWSITFTPCAQHKASQDCAGQLASPDRPHIVRALTGKPKDYSKLSFKPDSVLVDGGDGQYTCAPANENQLTANALAGLPAAVKGEQPGQQFITVRGVRFVCTIK